MAERLLAWVVFAELLVVGGAAALLLTRAMWMMWWGDRREALGTRLLDGERRAHRHQTRQSEDVSVAHPDATV